jgi:WD40 repeat protein
MFFDRHLNVWSLNNKVLIGKIKSNSECGVITCLSVCSKRGIVVTGHDEGMMCLWHGIDDLIRSMASTKTDQGTAQCTTLHWHAHTVASVSFTADGNHIISGGEEGVVVVWQIDTGFKAFVPRLGAAITYLQCSDTDPYVAVTTADNNIRIVNTARFVPHAFHFFLVVSHNYVCCTHTVCKRNGA